MDWLTRLETPHNALAILTAMITPAVLISACGALIFSTSTRGILGSLFMLWGSALRIAESRMALASIMTEMDLVWKISTNYAGKDLRASRAAHSSGSAARYELTVNSELLTVS